MASSRRTYDTDSITLRTVFAKNPGNSNVPALRALTADGAGGTFWAVPSSLGLNPSFNEIITSAATYTADLSYNKFRLLAGENIGMVNGSAGSNQTTLFAKAFSQFDLSGGNTLQAFSGNQLDSSVLFAGENGIVLRSDPGTNTLFIGGATASNTTISTGIYGFNQVKVTPSASTITSSLLTWGGDFLTASSPSSLLRFLGYNDIQLSTNVTTNSIFFTISTFTSEGYLNISNVAYSAGPSTLSTVAGLYVTSSFFGSTIGSLSTASGFNVSSIYSTINGLAVSTGIEILTLQGLVNARATIVQLNNEIAVVNSNLLSTVGGLGTAGYLSTGSGGIGDVTTAQLVSTATRWATYPAVSSIVFANDVVSTQNQIISPGLTFLNLVNDIGVYVTTSTNVDGITPFRGLTTSQLSITGQTNFTTFGATNYSYALTAGQAYTGTISTLTITNSNGSLGSLYISSVYLAAPEGAAQGTAGALTTDVTATKLFYSTNQLANVKVNVVVSTLGAANPQLFSEDIGKYFLFSTATASLTVNLPAVENGWNAVIKNLDGSTENFTVNTTSPAVLAPGVVTTVVCDGLSFYSL